MGDLLSMVALGGRAFLLLRWMMSMEREALNQACDPEPDPEVTIVSLHETRCRNTRETMPPMLPPMSVPMTTSPG